MGNTDEVYDLLKGGADVNQQNDVRISKIELSLMHKLEYPWDVSFIVSKPGTSGKWGEIDQNMDA